MDPSLIATILIFLSAIFGYINVRFLKLPNTIGLMIITIVFVLGVIALSYVDPTLLNFDKEMIYKLDFKELLLEEMLSFLLFAGALHTSFNQLKIQRWPVLMFSTLDVLTSTFLVGISMYYGVAIIRNANWIYILFTLWCFNFSDRANCSFRNFKESKCS